MTTQQTGRMTAEEAADFRTSISAAIRAALRRVDPATVQRAVQQAGLCQATNMSRFTNQPLVTCIKSAGHEPDEHFGADLDGLRGWDA